MEWIGIINMRKKINMRDYCYFCREMRDFKYIRTDIEEFGDTMRERELYECPICKCLNINFNTRDNSEIENKIKTTKN